MNNFKDKYRGEEAIDFAAKNLKKLESNPETWETEYICEETGNIWIMDYPHSDQHGGGSPRLRMIEKENKKNKGVRP